MAEYVRLEDVERVLDEMAEQQSDCSVSFFAGNLSDALMALPRSGEVWRPLDDAAKTGDWVLLRRSDDHDSVIAAQWDGEAATAWRWSALDQSYHESAFDEYRTLDTRP